LKAAEAFASRKIKEETDREGKKKFKGLVLVDAMNSAKDVPAIQFNDLRRREAVKFLKSGDICHVAQ
jgi:hypothetical protein